MGNYRKSNTEQLKVSVNNYKACHASYDNENPDKKVASFNFLGFDKRCLTGAVYFQHEQSMQEFLGECEKSGIIQEIKIRGSNHVSFTSEDKNVLAHIFSNIDKCDPFGKPLRKEIFEALGLKKIPDLRNFHKKLVQLVNSRQTEEAFKKANETDDHDILLWLGSYCEANKKYEDALICYQAIPTDNPNHNIAYFKAGNIKLYFGGSNPSLTLQEQRKYQEDSFTLFLSSAAAGDEDSQKLTDQIFNTLCGGPNLYPEITGVQPNVETLILLARQIFTLKQENAALRQECHMLRAKMTDNNNVPSQPNLSSLHPT
jgi:tetratricopeptide (TPR) repeat protein